MNSIPRMRTAPEAVAEIKKLDPETAFTLRALRRMMNTGEIPFIEVNSKRLINLDTLLNYLANPVVEAPAASDGCGKIRRING